MFAVSGALCAAEPTAAPTDFCAQCHVKEVEDISEEGEAHQTELSCTDCHPGHKPKSLENIPRCNSCHAGTAHYDQLQCLNCHTNPHRPMVIKLPKKAHAECLTCHESQDQGLQQHPSYHSQLVCTDCHYDHGFLPECLSCHRSHGPSMTESSCQTCHAPHKPLEMHFATTDIPTDFCAPCHAQATSQLEATTSRHGQLNCATCHSYRHGTIPLCRDCHGEPHAVAIHAKFTSCGECHGTAHSLE